MIPLLFFLGVIAGAILLSTGLGVALALGVYLFDRQLHNPTAPLFARREKPAPATVPGREPVSHRRAGPGGAIFALVILDAGLLIGLFVHLMPLAASSEARPVDILFSTMLGIAGSIFLLVEGVLIYTAIRFRRRKGETGEGLPIRGSDRLELAWTLVPVLIVLWLGAYSYQVFAQIRTPHPDALLIEVTSRQFQWEFHYPETDITSNDLYIPQGKPIHLKIESEDVIHSFWVPAFRIKQDAFPGRETEAYFTAEVAGTYPVVCAELCGIGHAGMGLSSHAIVQSQADFDNWVAEQQGQAGQPPDPVALFSKYGCIGCHTLTAANAAGIVGPNLDGIGTNAATRVPGLSAEEYIRQSILSPNDFIAPECPSGPCPAGVMPQDFATRMSQADQDALVNFLLEQK